MPELDSIQDGEVVNAAFDRAEVFKLAREDLNFFAALCLPQDFKFFFPTVHLAVWQLLTEGVSDHPDASKFGDAGAEIDFNFLKLALGLPRGHAKTTLLKLFVVWCVLFSTRNFFLVICAREDLAVSFLADVKDILDSPNIKSIFGDWTIAREKNEAGLVKFAFMGRPIVLAASGKGSIRGLNIKHHRPDVIVMDDFQKEEDSHSEIQADKDLRWMLGTLMKLKDPRRCLYVYIGNMYASHGCILAKLKKNKNWLSFIVGAILSDGQPIWPELHSLKSLLAEFENDASMGKAEIFFAEVMNDPDSGVNSIIDINRIPPNPYENDPVCTGKFIIIDVATDKIRSDDTTIALYGRYAGDTVMENLLFGSLNPEDTIKAALHMALVNGASLIVVESVAYQSSLLFWFAKYCEMLGLEGITFGEVFPKGVPKNARIQKWLKELLPTKRVDGNGEDPPRQYLSNKVRSAVLWQISQFKPNKKDNRDDIIDNGAYVEQTIEVYEHCINIPLLAETGQLNEARVVENNTCF